LAINLVIDDKPIDEARRIGGAVALQEYVARRKQLAILSLFGTVDFDGSYNIRRSRNLDRIEIDR
jgi:hypothetical protein